MSDQLDSPRAWVTVAAGFLSCFTLFGVAYSFGAFFKPMAAEFGATREATSAIFAITSCLYFLLGPLTGYLTDRFGPRPVVATGAIVMGTGLFLTSRIPALWYAYVSYGLGVGIGVSCCYVPLLAVVAGWFYRRRNTALGVAVSGIGAGTLAIPPVSGELIEHIGWRNSYAVLGAATTVLLMVCAALSKRPPAGPQHIARPQIRRFIREPNFSALYRFGADQRRNGDSIRFSAGVRARPGAERSGCRLAHQLHRADQHDRARRIGHARRSGRTYPLVPGDGARAGNVVLDLAWRRAHLLDDGAVRARGGRDLRRVRRADAGGGR